MVNERLRVDWVGVMGCGRLFFCGQPCGEFVGREDAEVGVHAVVAEAADLGAEDGVGAGECVG